jgi:ATP-binding cassette subfamily F protein uup
MAVPLLSIRHGMLRFGDKSIFQDLELHIYEKDRISLIGRNGSGKSTLLKVMAGQGELDQGEYFVKSSTKIGYLAQSIIPKPGQSIYQYVLGDDHDVNDRYLADQWLDPLYLDGSKPMDRLSGGKLRRADLARILCANPDLLLLDEPTNHLDLTSIEWLEQWLRSYTGTVVCISHDRAFLYSITNRMVWLDRGIARSCQKNFRYFDEWSEEIMEQEQKELARMGKKLDQEELWLQQGVTARRKRNQQRLKGVYALRESFGNQQHHISVNQQRAQLPELSVGMASKMIFECDHVHHEFTDVTPPKVTIRSLTLRVIRGEKIALMGRNGAGKSTFLKLVTKQLMPTSGTVKHGANISISYIDQMRSALNPTKTIWQTLCPQGGDFIQIGEEKKHVASYAKDFLFTSQQLHSPVSSLSGGEANRLLLATILQNPGTLLILDEPTNDLDMETLDMLQSLLSDYEGTLLLVSHDRDFVERIATRTLIFEGNGMIGDYMGGYQDYQKHQSQIRKASNANNSSGFIGRGAKLESGPSPTSQSPDSKIKSGKLSYKYQRELEQLPDLISALEARITELQQQLADSALYQTNPEQFAQLTAELADKNQQLTDAEDRWLLLSTMQEEGSA